MANKTVAELAAALEQLRAQVAELTRRMEAMEPSTTPAAAGATEAQPAITEEELLTISAALAAYLGVRPHIRQIRLISTTVWAQLGRVSIQASHRLQG